MYYLPENNGYVDQLYRCDQLNINELNSCLDMGDEERERDNFYEYFVYLQNYMHLPDPKTWVEAKYLFMVLKRYESQSLNQGQQIGEFEAITEFKSLEKKKNAI